ncbi:MAG: acyl carrier protein [Clostridia bacterium]|nr:acyl carrier protein [Clostridia bacterium]MDD3862342.1 acyl carrier protein [Clostridia bacterium]MDD4408904.1 acyl carrier protein [Clostridia bacterium]
MLEEIKKLIAKELNIDPDKITAESKLSEDLAVDSLDALELIMTLEEEFDISIPDNEAQNFKTVGDIITFIEKTRK